MPNDDNDEVLKWCRVDDVTPQVSPNRFTSLGIVAVALAAGVLKAEELPRSPAATELLPGVGASGSETDNSAAKPANPINLASETPAPTATEPARTEEVKQLREELKQLRADFDASRSAPESDEDYATPLNIYGFMDMGLQKLWAHDNATLLGTGTSRAGTFVLGNVNFYMDANPNQTWRGLTEIRITNYPNDSLVGSAIPALNRPEQRTNGTAFDVNAPDPGWNSVTWSAFVLEQSWIQGTFTDWFGVRVGYWLTPFGIWNIDHGSPTVIGLSRPQFTRGRFYPEHQLGVQAFGAINQGAWKLGYVAYVSNGKTQGALDLTNDKAFGMRLSAQTARPFPMAFGIASYTGRYSHQISSVDPTNNYATRQTEDVAYRQWDIGIDASVDIKSLRVRTEVAAERINYDEAKSELVWGIPGRLTPDRTLFGWYSIVAYRLPWLGLEPYTSFELYRYPTPVSDAIMVPGAGLNIHVSNSVLVKSQLTRTHFFDFTSGRDRSSQDTTMFASRLVLAF